LASEDGGPNESAGIGGAENGERLMREECLGRRRDRGGDAAPGAAGHFAHARTLLDFQFTVMEDI
jgi:hypothetical protein